MTEHPPLNRRSLLRCTAGLSLLATVPAWSQASRLGANTRSLVVVQIVDTSASQLDVSKDFWVGSRAAWQDINLKGGVRGRPVQHLSLEVDGSPASLRAAVDAFRNLPNAVALSGTAGDRVATQLVSLLRQEQPDMAHVAPWLQNSELDGDERTFPIFASRQEQIAHALKSLSVMGVPELGAVYASSQEFSLYRNDVERIAARLKIRLTSYSPDGDLRRVGQGLTASTPAIVLFIGGTPELVQFTQGIEKQSRQRYVIALADVNLQTMMQMGAARNTPVMATQVVPLVNSGMPVVRAYRETLARLFDEPPTPLSLAGYLAARYTFEVLNTVEGTPTRQNSLLAFQRRASMDLGGFRVSYNAQQRSGAFVTQSMLTPDGRLIG
jgi:ABC-type branched-subunit amino acid transport system substrate-binding protein